MYINFADIPGSQNLFLDFLYEFQNVEKFYSKNFRDISKYKNHFDEITNSKNRINKEKLVKLIMQQYEGCRPSRLTKNNIELLGKENTVAIVTGQQLGVFGGPLYTFYKIFTSIKLANKLKEDYPDYNFVPVFWLEGDDHDFDEVTSSGFLNKENDFDTVTYLKKEDDEDRNFGSVGKVKFKESIESTIDELESKIRNTEFSEDVLSILRSYYEEGSTFTDSFTGLMIELFDEYGLVLFNPQSDEVKKELQPIFLNEFLNYKTHTSKMVEVSAELEDTYHAQIKIKPINLFMNVENSRHLIEPTDTGYRLKGSRKTFTQNEIIELLKNNPESFSPNVLLRPICQDYLLPTAFYIGGPGEISYFAQVNSMYNFFEIPQPILYPRSSITLVEKNVNKVLTKYNLELSELFLGEKELNEKVINSISDLNLDELFNSSQKNFAETFDHLKEQIIKIDPTLNSALEKTVGRINQSLDMLKNKSTNSLQEQNNVTIRRLGKIQAMVYPNNNMQEREINYIYYANKYGMDLFKWIFNEMSINKFEHQLIEI